MRRDRTKQIQQLNLINKIEKEFETWEERNKYEWKLDLSGQTKTIQLNELDSEIEKILNGLQLGRVVIKHGD